MKRIGFLTAAAVMLAVGVLAVACTDDDDGGDDDSPRHTLRHVVPACRHEDQPANGRSRHRKHR